MSEKDTKNDNGQYRTPLEYQFLRKLCLALALLWAGTIVAFAVSVPVTVHIVTASYAKQTASTVNAMARSVTAKQ